MIAALALIGGLAAACFTKAFGIVFLGEPRSDARRARARGAGWRCALPMVVLAAACVAIGLLGAAGGAALVAGRRRGSPAAAGRRAAPRPRGARRWRWSSWSPRACCSCWSPALALAARGGCSRGRTVARGRHLGLRLRRARPPRMQYTASSFAAAAARPRSGCSCAPAARVRAPAGLFPRRRLACTRRRRDLFARARLRAGSSGVVRAGWPALRWLQHGPHPALRPVHRR